MPGSGRSGFSGLLFDDHTPLQPVQSNGVMELYWTVVQSSVSEAGSNRVMNPLFLILSEILSLAREILSNHNSFPFAALSWALPIPWELPADGRQPLAEVLTSQPQKFWPAVLGY